MKPYQTLKLQSLIIALLFIVATLVGVQYLQPVVVIPVTAAAALVALCWRLFRALHRQIEIQQFKVFRQSESLSGLYNTLDIQYPLPRTRH
jgi:predicted PurR-regulated permease PerM